MPDQAMWEVRDGDAVLTWHSERSAAIREALLLAANREPCQVLVHDAEGNITTFAHGWPDG